MKKKPYIFLIFKIIGLIGIIIFVFGIIKIIKGFGNFETNDFAVGSFMMPIGLFLGIFGIIQGFKPEITKQTLKNTKYIQEENEEELQHIISQSAKIHSEAVTTITKSVNQGFNETMFCKYCGKTIDSNSKFCKHCGEKI